ncbi:MAG TPA: DUF2071 domain-containing protein [Polyangiaceae bacterium]|jgi:hypothetical protein|nr:DUF2071 domain-containing protein [Polyangiaceae bacterium]
MTTASRAFLTARWEHLVVLNYAVPPRVLTQFIPRGTELDRFQGEALVSVVAFRFADTRLYGWAVPGHRDFEEVNLRFYVSRRGENGARKRAVVFVRELVPRRAIAMMARWAYNEPYVAVPMAHETSLDADQGGHVCYAWRYGKAYFAVEASVEGGAQELDPGSEAEFITEHYFGYTTQRDGGTLEYAVEHPPWRVWSTESAGFFGPAVDLYGEHWGRWLTGRPRSAFVAVGSEVTVRVGQRVA